jgi:tellurite resistance-related uncharacterized protein
MSSRLGIRLNPRVPRSRRVAARIQSAKREVPMPPLPPNAKPYHRTAEFTESSIPPSLLVREHATKPGVWERIHVSKGRIRCRLGELGERVQVLEPARDAIVEPGVPHRLELLDEPVRVSLEFLHGRDGLGHWSARGE